ASETASQRCHFALQSIEAVAQTAPGDGGGEKRSKRKNDAEEGSQCKRPYHPSRPRPRWGAPGVFSTAEGESARRILPKARRLICGEGWIRRVVACPRGRSRPPGADGRFRAS